ncbi:MAG: hypothetical protein KF764_28870 [Labilithrix sp.]|nr:hypothetical protein [Labilithrix sp.]
MSVIEMHAYRASEAASRADWQCALAYTNRGKVEKHVANVRVLLRLHPDWSGSLAYDEFSGRALFHGRDLRDEDVTEFRAWCSVAPGVGVCPSAADVHATMALVAREKPVHPVRDYLADVVWDGVPRIGRWLTTYLGVTDTLYTQTVGTRWLISAVARVWEPGCKADHVLILEGAQGVGKSTALSVLAGPWFSDTPLDLGNKDAYQALRGKWIVELGELAALRRAEVERVKAFFSASIDSYRPSYGRLSIDVPRQCVFAGSTNHAAYLQDETGGRRFWPVAVGAIDLAALRRDRDQLWAEALDCYAGGAAWHIDTVEAVRAAVAEQSDRAAEDVWTERLSDWLATADSSPLTSARILREALDREDGNQTDADAKRVAKIMRQLGYEHTRRRLEGEPTRIWVAK